MYGSVKKYKRKGRRLSVAIPQNLYVRLHNNMGCDVNLTCSRLHREEEAARARWPQAAPHGREAAC